MAEPVIRLNVGCGEWPIRGDGWVNLDADPRVTPDVCASVPPLLYPDHALTDVWACHFLEHLTHEEAGLFVAECVRCLRPGGGLGIVVPDTREIMRRYLAGSIDHVEYPHRVYSDIANLNDVCSLFLYSTAQDSPHRWSYDLRTLADLMTGHGLIIDGEIHRYKDPRIAVGAWYQCGLQAHTAGA